MDNEVNQFGIKAIYFSMITEVLRKYDYDKAVIYGSRAKGNYKNYSDIDIAIYGMAMSKIYELREELEEVKVLYKFDVVGYEHLDNENLKAHIDRVGIEIKKEM